MNNKLFSVLMCQELAEARVPAVVPDHQVRQKYSGDATKKVQLYRGEVKDYWNGCKVEGGSPAGRWPVDCIT